MCYYTKDNHDDKEKYTIENINPDSYRFGSNNIDVL